MRLLDLVIQEYISIVEILEQDVPIENNRLVVDKEKFKTLLEKYGYMSFNQKTKAYKELNFILHDKNNYSMPCKDHIMGKTVRKVVINYNTYKIIKDLYFTQS